MQEITSHKPGTMCWVDLYTTDTAAAKKFYNLIFGWEPVDLPASEGMTYTMLNINGKPVAALSHMMPDQEQSGMPPFWMSYISVEDASVTTAKVKELGGTVIHDSFEVGNAGRMAILADTEGAVLAVWQPKESIGMQYKNIPGTLCWVEHASHNPEKSIPFLENLFGWKAVTQDMGGTNYTTFFLGEEAAAGMYVMPPTMGELPCHWLPYFLVENIDGVIEKVVSNGGEILMPKMFAEGVGFFSVFRDPQGAVSGLVQGAM